MLENRYPYINMYTGEVYASLLDALELIIWDMIHHPDCRTIKMFWIRRTGE